MNLKQYTILLISNEPWGKVWYSKQHYANELSNLGHQVYFINGPQSWHLKHLFSWKTSTEKIKENLWVVNYHNNFPIRIFKTLFTRFNDYLNSKKIFQIVNKEQCGEQIILWSFEPRRFSFFPKEPIKRIYHVVDPYHDVPGDERHAAKANLIVSVSAVYKKFYQKWKNKYLEIPHGISDNSINNGLDISSTLPSIEAIFVGTINADVDFELLAKISEHIHLTIIGPIKVIGADKLAFEKIIQHRNISYLGVKHAQDLNYYISKAEVCIVPYKKENRRHFHRSPLKILNYLLARKPIITTLNYDVSNLAEKAIFLVDNDNSFIQKIKNYKGLQLILREHNQEVEQYLAEVKYPSLIHKILNNLK